MSFKEIVEYEKTNMNPIRRKVNYVLVPIFLCITITILLVIFITMSIDEEKYNTLSIILFSIIGLLCILLLAITPFVRVKELKIELSKYNFDKVSIEDNFEFYPIAGTDCDTAVIFKDKGLEIYGEVYDYSNFDIRLATSNRLNLINIYIVFTLKNSGEEYDPYLSFKLDGKLLTVIDKFNIEVLNKEDLDYIVNNKEHAFKQIYIYGYIKKKIF